ncbi:unnamed protein product [Sphagnum tenellum]
MSTMHDSRGSSTRGSENSSSPVRSSFEGGNGNGLASVYSSYSGSPSIHYPDRSIPDYVKLPGQSDDSFTDYSTGTDRNASTFGGLGSAARLSETHMASRRAEEAANRRCQAASWLQEMIGPLSLPRQPSEEELRLCLRNGLVLCNVINKVHPGAVPKVVENPISSHDGAQFAYQHFENVRNFLVAVEDMGLPAFEASDLEQGSLSPSSSAKVVACILALRSYQEWKQGGALGFWRLKSPNLPTVYGTSPSKTSTRGIKAPRKWFPTDQDYADNMELFSPSAQSTNSMSFDKDSRASFEGMLESNAPSQSLLSLVNAILGGKPMEEVPMLVEFMLRKVMEEFERHLLAQRRQVVKMKSALKDLLMQAEERASQNMVLEALAAGSQEEVKMITKKLQLVKMEKKQIEDENQLKEVALKRLSKESEEKDSTVQVLMNELDYIKRLDEEHSVSLENQKREIELKSQEKLLSLEKQLQESQQQRHEMEVSFTEDLKNQLPEMARAAAGYHKVLAENRQLYNEVQDLKGNIRVYCRVRPFLTEEPGRPTTVDYIGENGELVVVNPSKLGAKDARKSFTFNKVFGTNASQEEVFLDTQPLIRSVLDGYNVCIFAYGQTGSGKTFTMSGPSGDWGVNYRALHDLFNMTQSRLGVFRYEIDVQMLEIYNEQVRDLLIMDGTQKKYPLETDLPFLELFLNGMNVPDASMLRVRSTEDVVELMRVGQKNRAIGATALNERSSRSHSVLTVHVQGRDLISGALLRGSLHLVDLAGSERVDRSEATGDRLKEAQHINKSLSALGDVIAALAQKNSHVPYRNSKLTQLLQDSLGGQAKTLMFVHISPDMESFGETISTLKFAERVSSVELGAARSNKESGDMQNLKDQIAQLKDAAAKKDAEIERLQSLKDLSLPVESGMGVEKYKFKPVTAFPRRISMDAGSLQKPRRALMDAATGTGDASQTQRKLSGRPKRPPSLVLNTMQDTEDPIDHSAHSSAGSPLDSPTELRPPSEVSEEGVTSVNESIKYGKEGSNSQLYSKQSSKEQEAVLLAHQDMQDEVSMSDWHDRYQNDGTVSVSGPQGSEKLPMFENSGLHRKGVDGVEKRGCESGSMHSCLSANDLKSSSYAPYSSPQNPHEDDSGQVIPNWQEGNSTVMKSASTSTLHGLVLDDHFGNNELFDLQDGDQDDSGSLLSESSYSVDSDFPTLGLVDENKKQQSSPGPRTEKKAVLQSPVPRPPGKSARLVSPLKSDNSSGGVPPAGRIRRYTSAGHAVFTDKPSVVRTISLGGTSLPGPQGGTTERSQQELARHASLPNTSGGKRRT